MDYYLIALLVVCFFLFKLKPSTNGAAVIHGIAAIAVFFTAMTEFQALQSVYGLVAVIAFASGVLPYLKKDFS